jgi:signal peptidase II
VHVIFLSVAIIVLDQVTKLLVKGFSIPAFGIVVKGMRYGESIPLLGDFFRLTYVENPGMAFGINVGGRSFFAVISVLASIAIVAYLWRSRRDRLGFRVALAMVLGGALGNLIDRVFYGVLFNHAPLFQGRVVDFLDVDFFNITLFGYQLSRWPVFNVADACVTVGVILLLLLHRTNPAAEGEKAGELRDVPPALPPAETKDPA